MSDINDEYKPVPMSTVNILLEVTTLYSFAFIWQIDLTYLIVFFLGDSDVKHLGSTNNREKKKNKKESQSALHSTCIDLLSYEDYHDYQSSLLL